MQIFGGWIWSNWMQWPSFSFVFFVSESLSYLYNCFFLRVLFFMAVFPLLPDVHIQLKRASNVFSLLSLFFVQFILDCSRLKKQNDIYCSVLFFFSVCTVYRLLIDTLIGVFYCKEICIKSLDCSADVMDKKGRVNCIEKNKTTSAETKINQSNQVVRIKCTDCDRTPLGRCKAFFALYLLAHVRCVRRCDEIFMLLVITLQWIQPLDSKRKLSLSWCWGEEEMKITIKILFDCCFALRSSLLVYCLSESQASGCFSVYALPTV